RPPANRPPAAQTAQPAQTARLRPKVEERARKVKRKAPRPERARPMIKVSCAICGRSMEGHTLAEWPYFPFCSKRCTTIDLERWLGETYGIPAEEPDDSPSSEEPGLP